MPWLIFLIQKYFFRKQEIYDFNKCVPWWKASCYFPYYHGRLNRNNFSLFNKLKITSSKWPRVGT